MLDLKIYLEKIIIIIMLDLKIYLEKIIIIIMLSSLIICICHIIMSQDEKHNINEKHNTPIKMTFEPLFLNVVIKLL
jgi:hypothetical protein